MPSLRAFSLLAAASVAALALAGTASAAQPRVLAVEFASDVNPVTADYITGAIDRANKDGYDAVVLLVDTPGGLDSSMRAIIKSELDSKIPVIVYVSPPGSRDASAGVFITMAADVAAMAPETNIGSSTPISSSGGNIPSDLRRKVINDAVAYIRGLASEHGRNTAWAAKAVRVAANLPAREALKEHVVDVVAPTLPVLLDRIDGTKTKPKGIVLHTRGAAITTIHMSLWKRLLNTLIDPNLIAILLSLGTLGIIIELWHPGLVFPATFGIISLVLAFFGLSVLPVSWAGALLMVVALGFFLADVFLTNHGALTAAGAASFVVGALMLFDPAGPSYQVSLWVALAIAGTIAFLMTFVVAKIAQARRRKPTTGVDELVGEVGVVRRRLDPEGLVFVRGELWQARASDGPLEPGEPVRVDAIGNGLVLSVRKADALPDTDELRLAGESVGPVR